MDSNKPPVESQPDCPASEPQTQTDLGKESMPTCNESEIQEPDFSVLRRSRRINCLTHFVASWERFGPPRERGSTSSET